MAEPALPTVENVFGVLRAGIDPEPGTGIVELGTARAVHVDPDGRVDVTIALTTSGCPLRAQIQRNVRSRVSGLSGVTGDVQMGLATWLPRAEMLVVTTPNLAAVVEALDAADT
mgnify:FL=1|jgi:ATP-binding protein involved in chromosome partitioning